MILIQSSVLTVQPPTLTAHPLTPTQVARTQLLSSSCLLSYVTSNGPLFFNILGSRILERKSDTTTHFMSTPKITTPRCIYAFLLVNKKVPSKYLAKVTAASPLLGQEPFTSSAV